MVICWMCVGACSVLAPKLEVYQSRDFQFVYFKKPTSNVWLVSFRAMEAIKEREQFSRRLKKALISAGEGGDSPAALAREFNRRYPGKGISDYAARKWLLGESIPNQDKLRVLAQWLGVTNDWLRFGDNVQSAQPLITQSPLLDYELMRAIASLSEGHQTVVRKLVTALHKIEKQ